MKIGVFVLLVLIVLAVGCSKPAMPTSGSAPTRTASASDNKDCSTSCNSMPPNLQETCRYTCIGKMAIDKKDPSLCDQLSDANMKAMCVQNANAAVKGE